MESPGTQDSSPQLFKMIQEFYFPKASFTSVFNQNPSHPFLPRDMLAAFSYLFPFSLLSDPPPMIQAELPGPPGSPAVSDMTSFGSMTQERFSGRLPGKLFPPLMRLVEERCMRREPSSLLFVFKPQLCEDVMPGAAAAILLHETTCQPTEDGRVEGCNKPRSLMGSLSCCTSLKSPTSMFLSIIYFVNCSQKKNPFIGAYPKFPVRTPAGKGRHPAGESSSKPSPCLVPRHLIS